MCIVSFSAQYIFLSLPLDKGQSQVSVEDEMQSLFPDTDCNIYKDRALKGELIHKLASFP